MVRSSSYPSCAQRGSGRVSPRMHAGGTELRSAEGRFEGAAGAPYPSLRQRPDAPPAAPPPPPPTPGAAQQHAVAASHPAQRRGEQVTSCMHAGGSTTHHRRT